MESLSKGRCVPCEGGTSPMKGEVLNAYLRRIKNWKLVDNKLVKEFTFLNDDMALAFVTKTGKIAIKEGHHPVTTWVFNKVKVTFYTHAIGGLSRNDFIMAAKFDEAYGK